MQAHGQQICGSKRRPEHVLFGIVFMRKHMFQTGGLEYMLLKKLEN